jgi:hypothetical protein
VIVKQNMKNTGSIATKIVLCESLCRNEVRMGIVIYRLMERIDGERGVCIVPYRIAEYVKLWALTLIK